MTDNEEPIHVSTSQARAGATPGMTRYVLGASLILIIAIFAYLVIHGV